MQGQPNDLWGKLERDADGNVLSWHPLVDHCADVAAVFEALLRHTLLGRRLAHLMGAEALTAQQIARLTALAALHDGGKFNDGFQARSRPKAPFVGHVRELVAALNDRRIGRPLQQALGVQDWVRFFGRSATALLLASVGHHGRPVTFKSVDMRPALAATFWSDAALERLAAFSASLRGWLPLAFADGPPLEAPPAFVHAFNGVITLADWLGSDTAFFPYSEPDAEPRFVWAQRRALEALRRVGLHPGAARDALGVAPIDFGRIAEGHAPRGVQAAIGALPRPAGPSLTILEAPTGEGKTEAALLHYLRLFQAGEVDGIYFALPTRTAARQLYERIVGVAARVFGAAAPPVSQAVPGYLTVDGVEGARLPGHRVLWPDDVRLEHRARAWAAEGPKRFLAGAIVIGTIDQVLLSVLRTPHAHLRAAGLLRLLLVVDEVHASSAYMTRLLDAALRRLRAAGGHALLLSATLGGEARAAFLDQPAPALAAAAQAAYPLISTPGRQVEAAAFRSKPVRWSVAPIAGDPEAVARRALAAADAGARVLIIRNTVAGAIATQAALEALGGAAHPALFRVGGVPTLHHSRFARADRLRLDAAIEAGFGKGAPRLSGLVAVGTQTVEQSLDLDADLLICDLAPMDVLLQRIGRLHRHHNPRPAGFEHATVVVLGPEERDLSAFIGRTGRAFGPNGLGTVYPDLRQLAASRLLIEGAPAIEVPRDCRRLVELGLHTEALAAIAPADDPAWQAHDVELYGAQAHERIAGQNATLKWSTPFERSAFALDADRVAQTRLGAADARIRFETPQPGPFGEPVRELAIPDYWVDAPPDALTHAVRAEADGLHLQVGARHFIYDRLGLRPEE